ncbi:MAG: hypothetical protein WD928_14425 [Gammaproteobacteria bacterium]
MNALRYVVGAMLIGLGVALQFVPVYRARLAPLMARYRALRLIESRLFQLGAGFGLVACGIELLP